MSIQSSFLTVLTLSKSLSITNRFPDKSPTGGPLFSDEIQVACGDGVTNFRSGVLLLKKFGGSLTTGFWNRRVLLLWIFTSGWGDSPKVSPISSQHSITRVNNVRSWTLVFINDFSFYSPMLLII